MSGRRLLDAAAIYKASRGVASKYVTLRRHLWEEYSRTSSLVKAVKDQTDRVTLTVKAASALSERFNSPRPTYSSRRPRRSSPDSTKSIPSEDSVQGVDQTTVKKQGLEQDHFYQRSERNAIADPLPESKPSIKQEKAKRHPLPDGSIPLVDADTNVPQWHSFPDVSRTESSKSPLSEIKASHKSILDPASSGRTSIPDPTKEVEQSPADQARKLQRQAEKQIPSESAEPPTAASSNSKSESQGQEIFHTPSPITSQSLSGLPRVKLPKVTEDTQDGDELSYHGQIDQDVFYSSVPKDQEPAVPEVQAVPEQKQLPQDVYSEIFQSPQVARMLGAKSNLGKIEKESGLHVQQPAADTEQTKNPQDPDQDTFSGRPTGQAGSPSEARHVQSEEIEIPEKAHDKEIQQLGTDMAKDSESGASVAVAVPSELESKSIKAPYKMHESRVPSTRFGRIWQYGGLATSMAFGAVGESFRRATGTANNASGSLMLSAGNMERLVAKLSRMRGAALKLGQMMSFQDSKMLPAPINEVLQRVQDSADYMPPSQRNKVLTSNLGSDWRELFSSFDEMPMAAASIGQVHSAVLKSSGSRVAVKVQYPGVANSIDSDLSNLAILLTASRLLPKGLYLDKTIANARTELAWECDYIREAECGRRFQRLLHDQTDVFVVPSIYDSASGPQVLTMDYMEGIGVTKVQNLTQDQKDWIGTQILRLCLREITEFKFMQTDPNWTNFLFNAATQKLELLDFGASREFPDSFITPYTRILLAASRTDRPACRALSIQLGYLTGHESQAMLSAHISSMLTLAEPFMDTSPEVYDFRDQTITERVRGLIPVMVRERLSPPPEETYSLHRKLSGAFLLCARLGSRVRCREMFRVAMEKAGVV